MEPLLLSKNLGLKGVFDCRLSDVRLSSMEIHLSNSLTACSSADLGSRRLFRPICLVQSIYAIYFFGFPKLLEFRALESTTGKNPEQFVP